MKRLFDPNVEAYPVAMREIIDDFAEVLGREEGIVALVQERGRGWLRSQLGLPPLRELRVERESIESLEQYYRKEFVWVPDSMFSSPLFEGDVFLREGEYSDERGARALLEREGLCLPPLICAFQFLLQHAGSVDRPVIFLGAGGGMTVRDRVVLPGIVSAALVAGTR